MARAWAFLKVFFRVRDDPMQGEGTMTTELVKQSSNRPIRKVKFAGIAAALLTVITYAVSAAAGEAVISREAAIDAVTVLVVGGLPVVTSWFTKSSSTDQ